jgi:hypothetical protein
MGRQQLYILVAQNLSGRTATNILRRPNQAGINKIVLHRDCSWEACYG